MIKVSRVLAMAVFVCLLAGCEPQCSLFPLFTNDDKVYEKQLLGTWKVTAGNDAHQDPSKNIGVVEFSPGKDENTYDMKIPKFTDAGGTLVSTVHLVRLGNYLFIDLAKPELDLDKAPEIPFPSVAAHCFGRLVLSGDTASIDFLNDEWVGKQIDAGKLKLAYVETPDVTLLSANTPELRKFALEHAEDHAAFSQSYTLTRNK